MTDEELDLAAIHYRNNAEVTSLIALAREALAARKFCSIPDDCAGGPHITIDFDRKMSAEYIKYRLANEGARDE